MKLSNDFALSEFTKSDTATEKKIVNDPGPDEIENLTKLVNRVLQPLRDKMNEPLYINSGYRCPELNKAVGGVTTSQHVKGQAADVRVKNPRALLAMLLKLGLEFDQAILYPTFLHISYHAGKNRKQVLYAKGVRP